MTSFLKSKIPPASDETEASFGACSVPRRETKCSRPAQAARLIIALSAVVGFVGADFAPAAAQVDDAQGSGTGVPEVPLALPETPAPKYTSDTNLTGDWGGARNTLSEMGIEFELGYAMEFMGNPVGGKSQGETYVHNVLMGMDLDLEKLVGLRGTAFRVRGSQRSGSSLSRQDIDNDFSVQQLYGGGQTWRLVELEVEHDLFDGHLNLAYGRLSATDDFLTSPLYCQFVSNAICGQPPAPFFNMPTGITAYPLAVWGGRARVQPTTDTYLQVGVYDGDWRQDGKNKNGTNFTLGDNGVLVLSEAGYKPEHGLLDLPAAYKIGGYYHTGDFDDVDGTHTRTDNSGLYTLIDQMLYREQPDESQGLYGFFVFVGATEQDRSTFPYFLSGGLIYEGLFDARPKDKAAFAVASGFYSSDLRDAERNSGLSQQYAETILEANYQFQVTPYFYVRPDMQYVINPKGYDNTDNALVLGFEAGIVF